MVQTMLTRKSPSSKILPFCSAMVQGFAKKSNFWILVLTLTLHLTMYQLYHHDVGCFHMYTNLAVLSLLVFVWRMGNVIYGLCFASTTLWVLHFDLQFPFWRISYSWWLVFCAALDYCLPCLLFSYLTLHLKSCLHLRLKHIITMFG